MLEISEGYSKCDKLSRTGSENEEEGLGNE
jgi:hypothetical protein